MRKFLNMIIMMLTASLLLLMLAGCQAEKEAEHQAALDEAVAQTLTAVPTITSTPTITPSPTPTFTPTPVVVQVGPTGFPADVNPLTGLAVSDPGILDRRPVMIKVSNFPREGRPHAGLSFADIVFDYYTGEGGNRFMGVYYGQDAPQIGPIRSGRMVDRWLVRMYQGILGLEYAYAPVYAAILDQLGSSRTISGGPNTCPAICSIEEPQTVISVFADSAEMTKYYAAKQSATNTRQNLDGMAFNTNPPAGGVEATEFTMQFSSRNLGNWKYDPETKKYLRSIEAITDTLEVTMVPLTDRLTNEQLKFSNVVVLFVEIETLNADDSLHEYKIAGTQGRAVIFRDGKMYDIRYKSAYDIPIQFLNADGTVFELQPGNTWINMTGVYSRFEEEAPGIFRAVLGKP